MDVITSHENADFDCLGAMIAAKRIYPDAELVFSGARERNLREFFVKSTVYAYDFKKIREIDLETIERLILVDVRQADRIGPFEAVARREGVEVHIYDHHPGGAGNLSGQLEVIEPVGSSVTVFCHIFMEREIAPTPDEATIMMLGLYEDTGSLQFNSTSEKDFEAAAFLLRQGANLNVVSDFLTQELTSSQVGLLNELLENRQTLNANGVDVVLTQASIDHYVGDLAMLAHKLKDMENYNALLITVRMGDRVFLVGRSRIPEVDVGAILREFGGGGHEYAASGTVKELPLAEVVEQLRVVIQRRVRPLDSARQLMSYPVKTLQAQTTVDAARVFLTRYNINAAPVMDEGRIVGVISRQETEKAAHHKLAEVPVEEVMFREFTSASPDSSVRELQDLIVRHDQRFVPILEGEDLVGVVTRTDLLRHMVRDSRMVDRVDGDVQPTEPVLKRRQLARMLKSDLPREMVARFLLFGEVAGDLGMRIYLVGGFVRDLLLRRRNFDVDLVVEGDGIAFAEEFTRRETCRVRSHQKFGTAVIIFPDGFKVDVASARMEYYKHPAALPDVEHSSIKLDLYRRDFSINALAISLDRHRFGELLDFFGGLHDLRERAVRVLHSLSFIEDPTRVFRAIRFEQRLGFHIGVQSEYLLTNAVRRGFLGQLGGPRVLNELIAILNEPEPLAAIERMADLDLLKYLHPRLAFTKSLHERLEQISRTLHWFELSYTGETWQRWFVYLFALTEDLSASEAAQMAEHLGMSPQRVKAVSSQADMGRRQLQRLEFAGRYDCELKNSEIHAMLCDLPLELLLYLLSRAQGDDLRQSLSRYIVGLRHAQSPLTGKDLEKVGIPPGPIYRKLMKELLDLVLDQKLTGADEALAYLKTHYPELLHTKKKHGR